MRQYDDYDLTLETSEGTMTLGGFSRFGKLLFFWEGRDRCGDYDSDSSREITLEELFDLLTQTDESYKALADKTLRAKMEQLESSGKKKEEKVKELSNKVDLLTKENNTLRETIILVGGK